jgi:hypothetical protein
MKTAGDVVVAGSDAVEHPDVALRANAAGGARVEIEGAR